MTNAQVKSPFEVVTCAFCVCPRQESNLRPFA
jgi:hypothetical protein